MPQQAASAMALSLPPRLCLQQPAGSVCLGLAPSDPKAMQTRLMTTLQVCLYTTVLNLDRSTMPCLCLCVPAFMHTLASLHKVQAPRLWGAVLQYVTHHHLSIINIHQSFKHCSLFCDITTTFAPAVSQRAWSPGSLRPSSQFTPGTSMGHSWPSCVDTSGSKARWVEVVALLRCVAAAIHGMKELSTTDFP
jgi:hypothetical protein